MQISRQLTSVLFTFLTLSLNAKAEISSSMMQEISPALNSALVTCPQRIWPGYSFKNINVILIESSELAILWDSETNKIHEVAISSLPTSSLTGYYEFTNYEGKKTIIANRQYHDQRSATDMFRLIAHEGFHFLGQDGWNFPHGARGTTYPLNYQPRLSRQMLFNNLRNYFVSQGKNTEALKKASYWYQLWLQQAPEEQKATADGYEGSARYVDSMATQLSQLGCQIPDDQLSRMMAIDVQLNFGNAFKYNTLALDSEGYDLGGLASLILRFLKSDSDWMKQVAKGKTPVQILLENVEPLKESAPPALEQRFMDIATEKNSTLEKLLDGSIEGLQDSNMFRVALPWAAGPSTFSPRAFITLADFPNTSLMPMATALTFKTNAWSVTSDVDAVYISNGPTLCQDQKWLLVPKTAVSISGNLATIQAKKLRGTLQVIEKKDSDGFSYLCGVKAQ